MRGQAIFATIIFALMVSLSLCSEPVRAQGPVPCIPWKILKDRLAATHGESVVSSGRINERSAVIVMASPGGDTFTVIVVDARGLACPIAAGRGWEPGSLPDAEVAGDDS